MRRSPVYNVAARQPPIGGRRLERGRGRLDGIGRLRTHARAGAIPGSSVSCSPPVRASGGSSGAAMADVVDLVGGGAGAGGDGGSGGDEWRGKQDLRAFTEGCDDDDEGGAEDFETALRCRFCRTMGGGTERV